MQRMCKRMRTRHLCKTARAPPLLSFVHASLELNSTSTTVHVQQGTMEKVEQLLAGLRTGWVSDERKWLVSFRSPVEIWSDNPTYLVCEILFYVWTYLTLRHGETQLVTIPLSVECNNGWLALTFVGIKCWNRIERFLTLGFQLYGKQSMV